MAQRAIVTACSGDPGYFEAFLGDWWRSLKASTDLRGTAVWLIAYGLSAQQIAAAEAEGVRVLAATRNGSIPNLRWRDLPAVLDREPCDQVMMTDGSDLYFQRDVGPVFEAAQERIAAACEHYGELSRDHYLRLSVDCLDGEEIRSSFRHPVVNTGLVCGPRAAMLDLCKFVSRRIPPSALGVAGPDFTVVNVYLHSRGFNRLDESFNHISITSRRAPTVIDGRLCVRGVPVHVIHNAAAGFGVFQGFGFPNASLRINRPVLRGLRRGWIRYSLLARTPLLRRLTWSGKVLAGKAGAPLPAGRS